MTTAKISEQSAHRLDRLQRRFHKSKIILIDLALQHYEDQILLDEINEGYARLKADKDSWNEELMERQTLDGTVGDGLEDES